MLTENGKSIDFGSLAEDGLAEQQLVLVNCGRAEVTRLLHQLQRIGFNS